MVTIGDVLGVVAFLLGLGITAWALVVAFGLLFPRGSYGPAKRSSGTPFQHRRGIVGLVPLLLGVVLLSQPLPVGKLVGWVLVLAVLAVSVLGGAGLAHLAGSRLRRLAPEMTDYAAFTRGAGFLVAGSMFPLLGWFAFGPLIVLTSIGAGLGALRVRVAPPVVAQAN